MFFVVKVNQFQGSLDNPARPDKNGQMPVILTSYNGQLPNNARVISGTVAQRNGWEVGQNYVVSLTLGGVDKQFGEQYQYSTVGLVTPLEIATKINEFGRGVVQFAEGVKSESRVPSHEPV